MYIANTLVKFVYLLTYLLTYLLSDDVMWTDGCCCCYADDDTSFYYEIDGIDEDEDEDDDDDVDVCVKKPTKVTFSRLPIKV